MNELEGHSGTAKIAKSAAGLWIHQSRTMRPLAGNFMVVENDDISATTANVGDFPRGIRAAVHRHEESRRVFLKAAFDSRCAQPVAVLSPEREEAVHLRAGSRQNALEKRQRGDAIDIVVAIEDDSLTRF